jgi:hypothetical protein
MVMAARRWTLPLLAVVTAADLGIWGYSYIYEGGGLRLSQSSWRSRRCHPVPNRRSYGHGDRHGPAENLGVLRDLRLSIGYMGSNLVCLAG